MKTLKLLIAMVLLCMVAPTIAQDQGVDNYVYQASLQCPLKITLRTGELSQPITYRLSYHGAKKPTEGAVEKNGVVEMRLPVTHQWYDVSIGRAEIDKTAYTLEVGQGCASLSAAEAPAPVLSEDKFVAAMTKLTAFIHLIHSR
jgi:hypothetical protein